MPELRKTDHVAEITWLGMVPQDRENIRSVAMDQARATYAGFEGDFHVGLTRPACVRVRNLLFKVMQRLSAAAVCAALARWQEATLDTRKQRALTEHYVRMLVLVLAEFLLLVILTALCAPFQQILPPSIQVLIL